MSADFQRQALRQFNGLRNGHENAAQRNPPEKDFPAVLHPSLIRHVDDAEDCHQRGAGGNHPVAESVAEIEGQYCSLAGHADDVSQGQHDGHNGCSLAGA